MQEKFDPHQKAYVCTHVFDESAPVLLVSRPEGDWCFLCGSMHNDSASEYRTVGIGHLFGRDTTLKDVEDLPADWEAERVKLDGPWLRTKLNSDN